MPLPSISEDAGDRTGLDGAAGPSVLGLARWELAVALGALVAAAVAFSVTLRADFLAHPGWLAVQKADFILGPVFVGLYWLRVRPRSRLGQWLVAYGLVATVYIAQSASNRWLFGLGLFWELVMYLGTEWLILTFPTGRLDGPAAKLIMLGAVIGVGGPATVFLLVLPQQGADFSLSACRELCPDNAFAVTSNPSLALDLANSYRAALLLVALATVALLVWRLLRGSPPRRRALAVGTPVAVLFLLSQLSYQGYKLLDPHGKEPVFFTWLIAGARSFIWYGFLFALITAELYAGRVLRRIVGGSLRRPSFRELEGMLHGPIGDPGLRLGFWRPETSDWVDADGGALAPPGLGQRATVIDRDGRAAITIVHDQQLSDDPELLRAAGTVALLALENAELDAGWKNSLRALADSRARLVSTADRERRKLERDLHDGTQQRLVAASINLTLAGESVNGDPELRRRLDSTSQQITAALDELRNVAHGLYPSELSHSGLGRAFELLAARYPGRVTVAAAGLERFPPPVEAAVYYCGLEAVQNASKHAGPGAQISIKLYTDADELHLEVHDDGTGFDVAHTQEGDGLQNMRDRLGAVGGRVEITSEHGHGTLVTATAPLNDRAAIETRH